MANNYQETPVSGTSWLRCNQVVIDNSYGKQGVCRFNEERITTLDDGRTLREGGDALFINVVPTDVINLLDPTTGQPTGETMTHAQLYQALYSAYIAAAVARDNQ